MQKNKVKYMCYMAMMVAIYCVLGLTFTIHTGNLQITFKSLPVVVGAMLFGPVSAALIAFLGEFLVQLLTFGLMPNTILWVIPPVPRGIVMGLIAVMMWKKGRPLEKSPLLCYGTCLLASLVTSCFTTLCLWADSLLYGYYSFAYVFASALVRFGKDVIIAAIVTSLAIPMTYLIRQSGLVAAEGRAI